MKITNTTKGDLGIGPMVVPAGGSLEVSTDSLAAIKASAIVRGWFEAGMLTIAAPKSEAADPPVKHSRRSKRAK